MKIDRKGKFAIVSSIVSFLILVASVYLLLEGFTRKLFFELLAGILLFIISVIGLSLSFLLYDPGN